MRDITPVFVMVLLFAGFSAADSVDVTKKVSGGDIAAGDFVNISLVLVNNVNHSLVVKVKDKNIFAGNGLDIQCYELTLPHGQASELRYEPIQAFVPGTYALAAAEVSYINPFSGKEETAQSNELSINVKESKTPVSGQQQGISTVYECGNTRVRSTQYSGSGSSMQITMGGGASSMMQQFEKNLNDMLQPKSMQERLREMQQQTKQDMESVRQQMMQEAQRQNEVRETLKQRVTGDPAFKKADEALRNQGFTQSGAAINPASNETGDFSFNYQRQDNEQARLSGSMEKGNLQNLSAWSSLDEKRMQNTLEKNSDFQKAEQELMNRSFILQEKNFGQTAENKTSFAYRYKSVNGTQANITGTLYSNGSVEKLRTQETEEKKSLLPWFIALLIAAALAYALASRRRKIAVIKPQASIEQPLNKEDVRGNALSLLAEAEELYANGRKKEAYAKASEAVRYFFRKSIRLSEDVTDSELSQELARKKHPASAEFRECLSLCGLVKFAKYKANDLDFSRIIKLAKKTIR